MLSQLTSHVLDTTEELHTATDGIFTRKVFFVNDDGEGMSIQMMCAQNEAVAASPTSNSTDVVYLMYALITCQAWWQVSKCAGHDAQLKSGMSARHVYMYLRQQHTRARVCVGVCAYVYTGMFPILDYTGKVVESCGTSVSRAMLVVRNVWLVSSEACRGGESARGVYLIIMEWSPNTSMYAQVHI